MTLCFFYDFVSPYDSVYMWLDVYDLMSVCDIVSSYNSRAERTESNDSLKKREDQFAG